jgi:hypothetical protein
MAGLGEHEAKPAAIKSVIIDKDAFHFMRVSFCEA